MSEAMISYKVPTKTWEDVEEDFTFENTTFKSWHHRSYGSDKMLQKVGVGFHQFPPLAGCVDMEPTLFPHTALVPALLSIVLCCRLAMGFFTEGLTLSAKAKALARAQESIAPPQELLLSIKDICMGRGRGWLRRRHKKGVACTGIG